VRGNRADGSSLPEPELIEDPPIFPESHCLNHRPVAAEGSASQMTEGAECIQSDA